MNTMSSSSAGTTPSATFKAPISTEPRLPKSTQQRLQRDASGRYLPHQVIKDDQGRTLARVSSFGNLTEANIFHKNGNTTMHYSNTMAPVTLPLGRPAQPLEHYDVNQVTHYNHPNGKLMLEKQVEHVSGINTKRFYYAEDGNLMKVQNKQYNYYGEEKGTQRIGYQHREDGTLKKSRMLDLEILNLEVSDYNKQEVLKRRKKSEALTNSTTEYYQADGSRLVHRDGENVFEVKGKNDPFAEIDLPPQWYETQRSSPTLKHLNNTHNITVENPYRTNKAAATIRTTKRMAEQGMIPEGTVIHHKQLSPGTMATYSPGNTRINIDARSLNSSGMHNTLNTEDIKANKGYNVGTSFQDALAHEIGHQKHDAELKTKGLTLFSKPITHFDGITLDDLNLIKKEVSTYGATNPVELVAELENMRVVQPEKFKALPAKIIHIAEQYFTGDMFKHLT